MIVIAVVLAIAWLLGFTAFNVTSALLHLLIVAAVIAVVWHFVARRRTRGVL